MARTQPWRLIITPPQPGALNMAIDQALLESFAATARPVLRFYSWAPPCLSLGLAQRVERDVDSAACAALGVDIVRRPTGGRAILHEHELTYSLVIGVDDPAIGGSGVVRSYRSISAALCAGLIALGVQPELAPRPGRQAAKSAACFDLPSDFEITVQGRKLIGSAQARQQTTLLQHGSLLLHADADRLARVLRLPPALDGAALGERLIALDEVLGYQPRFEDVAAALSQGVRETWQVELAPDTLSAAETERAQELVAAKYGNPDWTRRR